MFQAMCKIKITVFSNLDANLVSKLLKTGGETNSTPIFFLLIQDSFQNTRKSAKIKAE